MNNILLYTEKNHLKYFTLYFLQHKSVIKFFASLLEEKKNHQTEYDFDHFQVSACEIYDSHSSYYSKPRLFTMLNLLRYPATVSFNFDNLFIIKSLRTTRTGICYGNNKIRLFYEDLLEVRTVSPKI